MTDLIASGYDEFGPWIVPAAFAFRETAEVFGRKWRRTPGRSHAHRTRGPWWRFWRRWDAQWLDVYRPAEDAVLTGGPADGQVVGTTAATSTLVVPAFRSQMPVAAAWAGAGETLPDPVFTQAAYRRTDETDAAGRALFRFAP